VIRLTLGCVSRCNTPEPCIEAPCDITIVLNPTTTSTSTILPITTTTTSSISTSTSTTSTTTSSSSSTTTTSSSSTTSTTTTISPTTTTTTTCIVPVFATTNYSGTTYRNGDTIPEVTDPTAWTNLTTGAWCYYNNDPANGAIYGKLYNWYAVNDSRGFAPIGYHVPSDVEVNCFINSIGGGSIAGGNMKETGTTHWQAPNTGATNSSGFTALPGGARNEVGTFYNINYISAFWSASDYSPVNAQLYYLSTFFSNAVTNIGSKKTGSSIRLVQD